MPPKLTFPAFACIALSAILLLQVSSIDAVAQNDTGVSGVNSINSGNSVSTISDKTLNTLNKKYSLLGNLIERQTQHMLRRMAKKEAALKNVLQRKDSAKAQQLFANSQQKYQELEQPAGNGIPASYQRYLPGIDSMRTSLTFLSQNSTSVPGLSSEKLQRLQAQLSQLQSKLQNAGEAEDYVRQREAQLKDQLLQSGFGSRLLGMNKEVYYYQQQLAQYKSLLDNKEKLEETILQDVRQVPAFSPFWQKYSMLAQLFPLPPNYGTAAALTGLQTNAQLTSLIGQQLGHPNTGSTDSTGNTASAIPQQYVEQAQGHIDQLKNKVLNAGGTNSNMTTPDFNPDQQHGKSLFKRLMIGFNMQTEPATGLLPSITDLGINLGVKINDQLEAGVGGSYKLGMGTLKCIQFTSQGTGARSFIDLKAHGNMWLTAGWEYNYLQSFKSLQDLHSNVDAWQKSALLGLMKKYQLRGKTASLQLLYDFLASQQIPKAQAVVFRVGFGW